MFSNIKNGWANFTYLDFQGVASYLTDPVVDISVMLLNGYGVVNIDEEGSDFDIVLTPNNDLYIVSHRDEHKLFISDEVSVNDFAKEFIEDFENNFDDWLNWGCYYEDASSLEIRKEELQVFLKNLKKKYDK